MNKMKLILIIGYFLITACNQQNEIIPEMETPIVAAGIVNGEEWVAEETFANSSEELFSFGLIQVKEEIGCPNHELTFKYIPFEIGSYQISSDLNNEPSENIVNSMLYYTCGDAIFASYQIQEDMDKMMTITSINEKTINGKFSATYILTDSFPDVLQNFEFIDVDFQIEL